nr:hypothetical protein CFP56_36399 [Quercus suber]
MEAVGLALALVATADLCLKYGKALAAACKSTEQADREVREMLLIVKSLWFRIESQLLVVRKLSKHLPNEFSIHQNLLLGVLQGHLQDMRSKVEKLLANLSLLRRVVYATILKDSLEKSVQNLEKWYHRWDPSWLMLARLTDPHVDNVIRQESHNVQSRQAVEVVGGLRRAHRANADSDHRPFAFLPADFVLKGTRPIAYSTAALAIRSDNNSTVITDVVKLRSGVTEKNLSRDVQALARVLSRLDPRTCNLLSCEAVKRNVVQEGMSKGSLQDFSFLFEVPPMIPTRIMSNTSGSPQSAQFVHKSIRPETVLVTPFGDSYLVGFESFRAAETMTTLAGNSNWEENLYRHPMRQGKAPEHAYIMQHDVYSLGICLLEIGMWKTFVTYQGDTAQPGIFGLASTQPGRNAKQQAFATKERFTKLAMEKLPSCMGEKYLGVVISCLTCLDQDGRFGPADSFDDEQGIDVGFRYIETRIGREGCPTTRSTYSRIDQPGSKPRVTAAVVQGKRGENKGWFTCPASSPGKALMILNVLLRALPLCLGSYHTEFTRQDHVQKRGDLYIQRMASRRPKDKEKAEVGRTRASMATR